MFFIGESPRMHIKNKSPLLRGFCFLNTFLVQDENSSSPVPHSDTAGIAGSPSTAGAIFVYAKKDNLNYLIINLDSIFK
jgi:hypothetical protein